LIEILTVLILEPAFASLQTARWTDDQISRFV